jgi:hypothetical protein
MPFFILVLQTGNLQPTEGLDQTVYLRAGLLAPGLTYLLRLPVQTTVTTLQFLSPVTAAGPRRILTVFPFRPFQQPLTKTLFYFRPHICQALTIFFSIPSSIP